jgi:hypothetical protein
LKPFGISGLRLTCTAARRKEGGVTIQTGDERVVATAGVFMNIPGVHQECLITLDALE